MTKQLNRALGGLIGALTLVAAMAGPAGATTPDASGPGPKLDALSFAQTSVDATSGAGTNTLTWSVSDRDRGATVVHGAIDVRQKGPHGYVGPTYEVAFGTSWDGSIQVLNSSGDVTKSGYTWAFSIPQYTAAAQATWAITKVTVADDTPRTRSYTGDQLDPFRTMFTATELVDSTGPTYDGFGLGAGQADTVYTGAGPATVDYFFYALDDQSGIDHGAITLTGPDGATIVTSFSVTVDQFFLVTCGSDDQNSDRYFVICDISVTIPADAAVGSWAVSGIDLTDVAGNETRNGGLAMSPLTVTRNEAIQASDFRFDPPEVDNWLQVQPSELVMATTGAPVISVLTHTATCEQPSTTPTDNGDGTISVTEILLLQSTSCEITGIKLTDAAGDVSVYGSYYGGPPVDLTLRRTPDTTPPIATDARLPVTTFPASTTPRLVGIDVDVHSHVGVTGIDVTVYDANGVPVGGAGGGVATVTDGTVQGEASLGSLAPGTYTVGFTIRDAGGLQSQYGYPGQPVPPWGALLLTVTDG